MKKALQLVAILLLVTALPALAQMQEDTGPVADASQPLVGRWRAPETGIIMDFFADGHVRIHFGPVGPDNTVYVDEGRWSFTQEEGLRLIDERPGRETTSVSARADFKGDDSMELWIEPEDRPLRWQRFKQPLPPGYDNREK